MDCTHLSLPVGVIVDIDGQSACHGYGNGSRGAPLDGLLHQVQGRRRVYGWHPVQATPAQVVTSPVMCNVHGSPVSCLPPAREHVWVLRWQYTVTKQTILHPPGRSHVITQALKCGVGFPTYHVSICAFTFNPSGPSSCEMAGREALTGRT